MKVGTPEKLSAMDDLRLGVAKWEPAADGRFLVNIPIGDALTPPITVIVNWLATLKK